MKVLITGSNGLLGQKLLHKIRVDNSMQLIATSIGENRVSETSGYTYFADAVPAGCGEPGNTIPLYCVPGMENGTWTGKALDITANAALFGLDQYTFAVVT